MTLSLGTPIAHYTVIEHVGDDGMTTEVYRGGTSGTIGSSR